MKYKIIRTWYVEADNTLKAFDKALVGQQHESMIVRLDKFPDGVTPCNKKE